MPIDVSKMTLPELLKHLDEVPLNGKAPSLTAVANLRKDLKDLLYYTFRKDVKFELPDSNPPFKRMDAPKNMGLNRLHAEMRKFQYFVTGTKLDKFKREKLFIEVLEAISSEEADLLLMVKSKKLTAYKSITRKLAEQAIPEIFKGEK
jgi:hypothetical protein